jgi:hypothetical protein
VFITVPVLSLPGSWVLLMIRIADLGTVKRAGAVCHAIFLEADPAARVPAITRPLPLVWVSAYPAAFMNRCNVDRETPFVRAASAMLMPLATRSRAAWSMIGDALGRPSGLP